MPPGPREPVAQREAGTPQMIPKAPVKEVNIETPLYHAVLTNAGPTIKSFRLNEYRQSVKKDSPRIELSKLENGQGEFLNIGLTGPSGEPEEPLVYQVDRESVRMGESSEPEEIVFRATAPNGLLLEKTFRFHPDKYSIDHVLKVTNQSDTSVNRSLSARLRVTPEENGGGYYSYVGFIVLKDGDLEEMEVEEPSEQKVLNGAIRWMAYENEYFMTAVIPTGDTESMFKAAMSQEGVLEGTLRHPATAIAPAQTIESSHLLYFGPRDLGVLKEHGYQLSSAVDFGWTDIIAKPLLYVLRFFNQYLKNYGLSIIVLTILIKILFWPLTHKSYKSMKEMQKLQPRMAKIREKYKNDRQKMNQELMGLYKTYKVNPMSGCLPMVIQIPVFIALFRLLGSSIELRHAPFILWINDLSAPDRLFQFPFGIPFMAPPYGIPVLTLLMGASMFLQQKMTPTPGDPTQAKIMMFLPIIFTFIFINFPSGLVLYWFVNNVLSIGQQYRIQKSSA